MAASSPSVCLSGSPCHSVCLTPETRRRHEELKTKTGQNADDGEEAEKEALGRGEWGIKERVGGWTKGGERMRKGEREQEGGRDNPVAWRMLC